MHTVSKQFTFCAAHRLQAHKGKCRFIHGHNYRVVVTLQSQELSPQGMVLDFSAMKAIIGEYFNKEYDHRLILERSDSLLRTLGDGLEKEQYQNIKVMESAPTAENMAKSFLYDIRYLLTDLTHFSGIEVHGVQVEETDGAEAGFFEEEETL